MKLGIIAFLLVINFSYISTAVRKELEESDDHRSWEDLEKLLDTSDEQRRRDEQRKKQNFDTQASQMQNLIFRAREHFENELMEDQTESDIKRKLVDKMRFLHTQEVLGLQTRDRCSWALQTGKLPLPASIDAAQHWRDILVIIHTNLQEMLTAQVCHQLLELGTCTQEIQNVEKYIRQLKHHSPAEPKPSKDS